MSSESNLPPIENNGLLSRKLEKMSALVKDLKYQLTSSKSTSQNHIVGNGNIMRPQTAGPTYTSQNVRKTLHNNNAASMIENFNQIVWEIDLKQAQFDACQTQRDEMLQFIRNILSLITESQMDGSDWYMHTQSILSKTPNMFGKYINHFQNELIEKLIDVKHSRSQQHIQIKQLEKEINHKSKIIEKLLAYGENAKTVALKNENNINNTISNLFNGDCTNRTIDTIPEETTPIQTIYDCEKLMFVENITYLESYINEQYSNMLELVNYFENDAFWQSISDTDKCRKTLFDIENQLFEVEQHWNNLLNDEQADNIPERSTVISQAIRLMQNIKREQRQSLHAVFSLYSRFSHCYQSLITALNDSVNRAEIIHNHKSSVDYHIKFKIEIIHIAGKQQFSMDLPRVLQNLEMCHNTIQKLTKNAVSFHYHRYLMCNHILITNKKVASFEQTTISDSSITNISSSSQNQQSELNESSSLRNNLQLNLDKLEELRSEESESDSYRSVYEASNEAEEEESQYESELSQTPLPRIVAQNQHITKSSNARHRTQSQSQSKSQAILSKKKPNKPNKPRKFQIVSGNHLVKQQRPKTTNLTRKPSHGPNVKNRYDNKSKGKRRWKNKGKKSGMMQPMEMKDLLNVLQNQTNDMVNLVSFNSPSVRHDYVPLLSLKHDKEYIDQILMKNRKTMNNNRNNTYNNRNNNNNKGSSKNSKKRSKSYQLKPKIGYQPLSKFEQYRKHIERVERDQIILVQNFKKSRVNQRDKLYKRLKLANKELIGCNNRILTLTKQKQTAKDKENRLKQQCKKEVETINNQISALKKKPRKSLSVQDLKQLHLILPVASINNNNNSKSIKNIENGQITRMMIEQMIERKHRIISMYKRQILQIRAINRHNQSKKLEKQKRKLIKHYDNISKEIKKFNSDTRKGLLQLKKAKKREKNGSSSLSSSSSRRDRFNDNNNNNNNENDKNNKNENNENNDNQGKKHEHHVIEKNGDENECEYEYEQSRNPFPDSMINGGKRRPLSSFQVNNMTDNDLEKLENESSMTQDVLKVLKSQQELKRILTMKQYQNNNTSNNLNIASSRSKINHNHKNNFFHKTTQNGLDFRPNTAPTRDINNINTINTNANNQQTELVAFQENQIDTNVINQSAAKDKDKNKNKDRDKQTFVSFNSFNSTNATTPIRDNHIIDSERSFETKQKYKQYRLITNFSSIHNIHNIHTINEYHDSDIENVNIRNLSDLVL